MTEITAAPAELAALVCTMRADWDRRDVEGAIHAAGLARENGWTWARTVTEFVRLACDPGASPRALSDACRSPIDHRGALPNVVNAELAGHARQLLAAALGAAGGAA